jgi:hypothetical protein
VSLGWKNVPTPLWDAPNCFLSPWEVP